MGQLWHRQPGEPANAYEAFRAALERGERRKILEVYRDFRDKPNASCLPGSWKTWIRDWAWDDRFKAFDKFNIDEEIAAQQQADTELFNKKLEEYRKAHEDGGKSGFNLIITGTNVLRRFISDYDHPRDEKGRFLLDENGQKLAPKREIKTASEAQSLSIVVDKYTKISSDWWDKALGIPELQEQLEGINAPKK